MSSNLKTARRPAKVVSIHGVGDILIRCLTVGEIRRMQAAEGDEAAKFLLSAVVDEAGNPVFSCPEEMDDMGMDVVRDIIDAIQKINQPSVDDQKK